MSGTTTLVCQKIPPRGDLSSLVIGAPLAGWVTPIESVPDPVFSGRVLGDGIAIDPFETVLRAPCAGVVLTLHRAHHALTLRSDAGAELLIHIGLDTVALKGEGFTPQVEEGQRVAAGDPLIAFDLATLSAKVPSLMVPVILTNADAFEIIASAGEGAVAAGGEVMRLRARHSAPAETPAALPVIAAEAREDVVVAADDGLHARPAGLIAQCAKEFAAEITLQLGERSVSALSAVAIMGLGVEHGQTVSVVARGADAAEAVRAVAARIRAASGEAAPVASAASVPVPTPVPAPVSASAEAGEPLPVGVELCLSGVTAAPGVAMGHAVRIDRRDYTPAETGAGEALERARLEEALSSARAAVHRRRAGTEAGSAAHGILSAHLAFLEDPELRAGAEKHLLAGKSAGWAWHQSVEAQAAILRGLGTARFVERINDLIDIDRRVQAALLGENEAGIDLPADAVLVASDLLPSQMIGLEAGRIVAIVTGSGGPTSHVAILAGARGIPALVAVGAEVGRIAAGTPMLVNADQGAVYVYPRRALLVETRAVLTARRRRLAAAAAEARTPCRTADGLRVEVFANLGTLADVGPALAAGAEGCGLLRSEFLFLHRDTPPDEASQLKDYQEIATAMGGRPLVVRTLDAGADKALPYLNMPADENPQLGVRGIRLGLVRPELLRTQIRAILRVAPAGQCRIMLPMVSSIEELRRARAVLEEEKAALGISAEVPLGIMVEVPSAAVMADVLAAEADFFSVGTNDLTQYVLAMDRMNPALARYVDALHPAVLRLIRVAAEGARKHGRWVGVCGALASVPLAAPVLVGLGVTELSTTAAALPQVKAMLRSVTEAECRAAAEEAVAQPTAADVRAMLGRKWPQP
jgi:phosphocarrier protein FPr/phosphocarrier protein